MEGMAKYALTNLQTQQVLYVTTANAQEIADANANLAQHDYHSRFLLTPSSDTIYGEVQ